MTSLFFKFLPRAVSALLFWDIVTSLIKNSFDLRSILDITVDPVGAFPVLLQQASVFSAFLTVATGSPLMYSITILMIIVSKAHNNPNVPLASILGLFLILVLDTVGSTYRGGQNKSVRYESKISLVLCSVACILFISLYALPSIFAANFIVRLITALRSSARGIAIVLSENLLIRILLIAVVGMAFYSVLRDVTEIASTLLYPSKKAALVSLKDESEINLVFKAPLEFLRTLIISSFTSPIIYVVLYNYVGTLLNLAIKGLIPPALTPLDESSITKLILSVSSFTFSWFVVSKTVRFYEELRIKGILMALVLFTLMMYTVVVLYTYVKTLDLLRSLMNPDFGLLERDVQNIYYSYYLNFVFIIDSLSKLVGFAP